MSLSTLVDLIRKRFCGPNLEFRFSTLGAPSWLRELLRAVSEKKRKPKIGEMSRFTVLVGVLSARVVHASFGTAPDATVCTGTRVPNVHHRVWVGNSCPPMQDLVSLLVAALLLDPDRLQYLATHAWWEDTPCAEVAQCHRAFGVEHKYVDTQNMSTPFMAATRYFRLATNMAHSQCTVSDRRCFRREHVSDFIRLFVVNEEGGYYLDADSFVVDARLHAAFAACPFAMFSSVTESPYHEHMNNGAFLSRPKSAFGAAWWQYLSSWDGSLWSDHSCGWPGRRASAQPDEVHVSPAMLVPPPFLAVPGAGGAGPPSAGKGKGRRKHKVGPQRSRSYEAVDPNEAAAAGAMLVHLTNWKARPDNVTQPLLLAVLDRAMRLGSGWRPGRRTEPRRQCLATVRRRLLVQPANSATP